MAGYDPAADPVHGSGWNSAARWGGWSWDKPRHGEHFRRCSFCGSVNPEDLAAEPSWHADWADQKYGWPHKFYVDIPNRSPGALYVIGSQYGPPMTPRPDGLEWVAWADLSRAQQKIAKRDGYDREPHPNYIGFGTRDSHFGKFYTIHLADPAVRQDVKDAIQRVSGLRFTFTADGKVGWERWAA